MTKHRCFITNESRPAVRPVRTRRDPNAIARAFADRRDANARAPYAPVILRGRIIR